MGQVRHAGRTGVLRAVTCKHSGISSTPPLLPESRVNTQRRFCSCILRFIYTSMNLFAETDQEALILQSWVRDKAASHSHKSLLQQRKGRGR